MLPIGETTPESVGALGSSALNEFDIGFLVGLLVGEGHFGGDGKQPQVTLKMHVDHVRTFQWLVDRFPESRLYGPYNYEGRRFYQWMARGRFLREVLIPLLDVHLNEGHSGRVWSRYQTMKQRYGIK